MRKGPDGGKRENKKQKNKKTGGKKRKRQMKIVATTSLPAVDRPNADHWNAARSRQKKEEKIKGMLQLAVLNEHPEYEANILEFN